MKPKLLVHFGAGDFIPGQLGTPIRPHEYHIVYDPDKRLKRKYARFKSSMGGRNFPLYLMDLSGEQTGLESNSVYAVHIHNVFSDPEITPKTRASLLLEASRILRPGGTIYLLHHRTPKAIPKKTLKELARLWGLKMSVLVENTGSKPRFWNKKERKTIGNIAGRLNDAPGSPGAYLAVLTKPKKKPAKKK